MSLHMHLIISLVQQTFFSTFIEQQNTFAFENWSEIIRFYQVLSPVLAMRKCLLSTLVSPAAAVHLDHPSSQDPSFQLHNTNQYGQAML